MAVRIEVSEEIDRRVPVVFKFYADDHVRNHPRWDPDIELWRDSDEPLGLGTIIQRRNSRSGTPVEGTMEVVEYEPNQTFGVVIREGPMETHGRATFAEAGEGRTRLTVAADFPIDESMRDRISGLMQRSVRRAYESLDEAKKALSEISNKLRENEPLEITSAPEHANRIFLIPAYRVHYVVCAEVERPMDRRS